MLALLIGAALALACLAVVSVPFLRKRPPPDARVAPDPDAEVTARAAQGLRALEVERQVGELTEAEFAARREELRLAAARALREQARALHRELTANGSVESEVLAVRRARSGRALCPMCNASVSSDAQECPRCGGNLSTPRQPPGALSDA